jgi:hypothetical protein
MKLKKIEIKVNLLFLLLFVGGYTLMSYACDFKANWLLFIAGAILIRLGGYAEGRISEIKNKNGRSK